MKLPGLCLALSLTCAAAVAQVPCTPFPIYDDMTGTELSLSSAGDGTDILLVILHGLNEDISVRKLTPSGLELPIDTSLYNDGGKACFGAGEYLLLGEDASGDDVLARFLLGNGSLTQIFNVTTTPNQSEDPIGAAFDGTNFLVLQNMDTNGQGTSFTMHGEFVSPAGVVVGSNFAVSPGLVDVNVIETLAWNGITYIAVWADTASPPSVWARTIPSTVGGTMGTPFVVRGQPAGTLAPYPIVKSNGTDFLVAWNEGNAPQVDIKAQLLDSQGNLLGGVIDVCSAPNMQLVPFIASDGSSYLVTWTDFRNDANFDTLCSPGEGSCADLYGRFLGATGVALSDEFQITLAAGDQTSSNVTFGNGNYLVTWTEGNLIRSPTTTDGVYAKLIGSAGCPLTSFCSGDGTLATPCPCANTGGGGRGCANSGGPGAMLAGTGTPSLASDTLVLSSSGELPTALSIFLQGTTAVSPLNFGDGLRCSGGSLKRLYVKNAVGGTATAPAAGDSTVSARCAALGAPVFAGSTRYMQTYYRDPSTSFCPAPAGNTYNISSGVVVSWSP